MSSSIDRSLSGNRLSPRSLSNLKQELPQLREYSTGSVVQLNTCSTGNYYFKYLCVPAPFRLYALRILATNYANPAPAGSTIKAALFRAASLPPTDFADMSGSASGNGPQLKLMETSSVLYTAASYDSVGGDPTVPVGLPSTWGFFTFPEEHLLLPASDYYLGFSVYGGAGTFGFWTDCAGGSNLNADGWGAGTVPSDNSFPGNPKPNDRGYPTPAVVMHSKIGCKRSGFRIS